MRYHLIPSLGLSGLALCAGLLASCSSKNDTPQPTPQPKPGPQPAAKNYVLAVNASASGNQSTTLLLKLTDISSPRTLSVAEGLQTDGGTEYVYLNDHRYLYSIAYRQAGKTATFSYALGADGALTKRSKSFEGNRFTSFGVVGNTLITSSTGQSPQSTPDAAGYRPMSFLLTYLDTQAETQTQYNQLTAENFLGTGEFVTLCGLQPHEGKIYAGIIPMGLSQYGANIDAQWQGNSYVSGKWVKKGNEDLVKTQNGGAQSSAYKRGELQWTQYPDSCHVAIFADSRLSSPKVIKTDRISYPAGRFKSQYYQMIWPDASGDLYVFSPSFAKTMTDARQRTKLPAGVMRIRKGTEAFDASYYYNLDQLSGDRGFQHVFPLSGDAFLLYLYDQSFAKLTNQQLASQLAIFHAQTGRWVNVTGLPQDVTEFGGRPLVEQGLAYVPVMSKSQRPALYSIDLTTGAATRRVEVEATRISSVGYLQR